MCGVFASTIPAASIRAQEPEGAIISGRISDAATAAPMADVLVVIEGTGISALTDDGGRYRLEGVPPGPRVLRAQRIGLATARVRVTVPAEGSLTQDIALSVSALRLQDITVTADAVSRAEGELGTASVIERDAIEHITATSLAGVLQLVPGVSTRAPGLGDVEQIALRTVPTGSSVGAISDNAGISRSSADLSAFGTLIVLDGVPLSNNANLQSLGPRGGADLQFLSFATTANRGIDLRRIPAAAIERVEVIRGVPSVRHGDLTQGAILVETRAAPVSPIAEVKLDERTFESNVVGGHAFGRPGHAGTMTFDVARTRVQPGVSDDESTRFAGQFAHRMEIGGSERASGVPDPKLQLDTRFDVFQLVDNRPENPIVRKNRSSETRDLGVRISERARLRIGSDSRLSFTGSLSRIDQESVSRAPKVSGVQPFTPARAEGRNEGFYIGGTYVAEVELDGRPWLGFGRLEWEDRARWLSANHQLLAGVELRREWNNGAGFQFDPQFPPSIGWNGVHGYDRTRTFDEVPALATSAFYLGERLSTHLGPLPADIQAGIRLDLLHDGGSWFGGTRDQVVQPRISAETAPLGWFRLRGGWGRTAKVPAVGDLFPARQYFDLVNVNYFSNDPAERLAVLTTFIEDPTNAELGFSVGTKAEAGFEIDVGDGTIALTAFRDRIDGAVGIGAIPDFITRDHFALTDSITGNGVRPEIILPATFSDTVPVLIDRPGNMFDQVNRGLELTAALPRITPLATQLYITGSWLETRTSSDGRFFGTALRFSEFQLSQRRERSPYWEGLTERGESMMFLYRFIHHQPELGLVATLTVQHNVRNETEDIVARDTLAFAGYVTRAGQLVPVPPERRSDPEFSDLRLARSGRSLPLHGPRPDWMMHFQVSKALPLDGQLRVWAFNFFDRRGQPWEGDRLGRPYAAVRFGAEITFRSARIFGR
ncbi:TonB-dependent receptor [Candidatus Palauibacter sp.]|uniref:TonB-dependent receptor n=1 Tax=Candidatus Palauibacter sp. TaxID=3101350 RepID=UPI003B51D36B